MHFEPTYESVHQHKLPKWYDDAKFGIFIHWGLFSVPGWAVKKPEGESMVDGDAARRRRGVIAPTARERGRQAVEIDSLEIRAEQTRTVAFRVNEYSRKDKLCELVASQDRLRLNSGILLELYTCA